MSVSRSRRRIAILPIAALGALALAMVTGGTANAATVTGGTVSLTISDSYLTTLADSGVAVVPTGAASVTAASGTVTTVYNVTGGDANFTTLVGTVDASGGLVFFNCETRKEVKLSSLEYSLYFEQFEAAPSGGSAVALVDLPRPRSVTKTATSATLTDSSLVIDSAGAAYLNSTLGTTVFQAGQSIGSFATTVNF